MCEICGENDDPNCDDWKHRPLFSHPIGEIYDIGRWCYRCQEGQNVYCQCFRVRAVAKNLEKIFKPIIK